MIPEFANHTDTYGEPSPYDEKDPTLVLWQQPGAPCNEYKGYCDVFYKCRDVDSNGPLSRLAQAILNPEVYENIAEWIQVRYDRQYSLIGRQYGIINKAAIALQCKLNVKVIAAMFFILYSILT